jgi:folate-binding protein YgfZ
MSNQNNPILQGYQAALIGSAYYLWENPGFLRIGGADRQAFLQRQTTNDLLQLEPSGSLVTVLTNPAARILDVLYLLDESDHLLAITLPGRGETTDDYLRSRIFFNDQVNIEQASHSMALIDLVGPGSVELLTQIGCNPLPTENAVVSWEIAGGSVIGFIQHNLGYRLVCHAGQAPDLLAALDQSGAARLPYEVFDLMRIEAGLPAAGQELSEEYTPLEAGLDWAISSSKGCYTGQEVIARQITYDKVTRHLAGLRLDQRVQPGETAFCVDEDRPVGTITSAAISPRLGPIALAILRRPFDQPGSQVTLGSKNGPAARIVPLPF